MRLSESNRARRSAERIQAPCTKKDIAWAIVAYGTNRLLLQRLQDSCATRIAIA
jgi:hypothetical protein